MACYALEGCNELNPYTVFKVHSVTQCENHHRAVPPSRLLAVAQRVVPLQAYSIEMRKTSGKYSRENPKGDGGRLSGFDIIPFDREHGYDVVDKLREIGERHHASPAQIALAWLLSKPYITSILMGASKISQLDDNLGAVNLELSADELAELNKLTEPKAVYPNWFNANIYDKQVRDALGIRSE
jgi:aryl-alcohol dehydrogenase-like predicted oxidoreductase